MEIIHGENGSSLGLSEGEEPGVWEQCVRKITIGTACLSCAPSCCIDMASFSPPYSPLSSPLSNKRSWVLTVSQALCGHWKERNEHQIRLSQHLHAVESKDGDRCFEGNETGLESEGASVDRVVIAQVLQLRRFKVSSRGSRSRVVDLFFQGCGWLGDMG